MIKKFFKKVFQGILVNLAQSENMLLTLEHKHRLEKKKYLEGDAHNLRLG